MQDAIALDQRRLQALGVLNFGKTLGHALDHPILRHPAEERSLEPVLELPAGLGAGQKAGKERDREQYQR